MCASYEILLADPDCKRVDLGTDPWASAARPPDGRPAHLDAELEHSDRIGAADPMDQGLDFGSRLGASGTA